VFYENWQSAAHLEAHAHSAHIRALQAVEPDVFTAPPEISRWAAVR
jgi:quinol monooxygenase YgiN